MSVLDLGFHTTLTSCSCQTFKKQGSTSTCPHILRLAQELTYFNTAWNPFAKRMICLCSRFEFEGVCAHVLLLQGVLYPRKQLPS